MKRPHREIALGVLRRATWLEGYAGALVEALVDDGRLVALGRGEWAQAEGDDRGGLFLVIDGVFHTFCKVGRDREVMIGHSEAGAVLGHATRFSGGPRLVTAVCAEPGVLLEVSEAALERIAVQWPEIWRAIAGFAYANMRDALRMAAEVISLPPRQRIAARLLVAARTGQSPSWNVRVNQQLLGEMVGVTRKTVNLHLSDFEASGLIDRGYGRIVIRDVAGLQAVADV